MTVICTLFIALSIQNMAFSHVLVGRININHASFLSFNDKLLQKKGNTLSEYGNHNKKLLNRVYYGVMELVRFRCTVLCDLPDVRSCVNTTLIKADHSHLPPKFPLAPFGISPSAHPQALATSDWISVHMFFSFSEGHTNEIIQ